MIPLPFSRLAALAALVIALGLAACAPTVGLSPGLVARMDVAGARLDADAALGLVNDLRARSGAPALVRDAALEAAAAEVARAYAASGRSPARPGAAETMMTSAGYVTFAETFSGWRGSKSDVATLTDAKLTRAGLAVTHAGDSEFGTFWVLLGAP